MSQSLALCDIKIKISLLKIKLVYEGSRIHVTLCKCNYMGANCLTEYTISSTTFFSYTVFNNYFGLPVSNARWFATALQRTAIESVCIVPTPPMQQSNAATLPQPLNCNKTKIWLALATGPHVGLFILKSVRPGIGLTAHCETQILLISLLNRVTFQNQKSIFYIFF